MSITSIIRNVFLRRQKELERHQHEGAALQQEVWQYLTTHARDTEYGRKHLFSTFKTYEDFARLVPVNSYEELKGDIDRMRHGESNVLWPGEVKWYAKSSGTTNDKSKFIPVSPDGLKHIHYAGGYDSVALYLRNNPKSRLFDGRALILGGSHSPNYNFRNSLVGDLSAILIENINPLANLVRVPKKATALLSDFEVKRDRIAQETLHKNVTNLSGVPSWMLSVLTRVMELSGKKHLEEVWPNLEVFFHGGVAFTPYRQQYEQLITSSNMHYMETYNASEGFFGLQDDPDDPAMLLMLDYGVFYEFIPMEELDKEQPTVVPLWGVETGKNYAMLISTSCGLWRYLIGDTVRFTSKNPYKFIISGRTKHFINAFGEELIVDNAEKGLHHACEQTGAEVLEYTAAPVFMDDHAKCRHQWLIEFAREPQDMQQFGQILDQKLQEINSDYEAKRYKDITLQPLEVIPARKGLFNDWLKSKGKLGGQHKIPRLSNSREYIEQMLRMMCCLLLCVFTSCAKMGQPDGGWYDETPPRVVGASPDDKAANVKTKKMAIYFNEYIKLDNPTEKVVVSPPQLEMPEIKAAGKRIVIELMDSLKENTTYTIDFSDAISDNNEDNPLGNFTYSFSTGEQIDTLEVAGYVVDAENLEPIKGILVGLYSNLSDTIFSKEPMLRVSRTDSRGHFVIKGVKEGSYRVYALQDADGDYKFSQKSEKIAFNHDIIVPSWKPDVRQDTVWRDSLHIDSIARVPYTHFLPDDIVLRAFTEVPTERYYLKNERKQAGVFSLFFSNGDSIVPRLRGLNFNEENAFVVEPSEKNDTITYWLRDSLLINQDTLMVEATFNATDTAGVLTMQTDTLTILSKEPYEKRMKQQEKDYNEWKKKQEKAAKRGEKVDSIMPVKGLEIRYDVPGDLAPDGLITISAPIPVEPPDTAMIHLYSMHDSVWYKSPFLLRPKKNVPRTYELLGEWRPGVEYSLEIDSATFRDIYGRSAPAFKKGFKVKTLDVFSSLAVTVDGMKDTTLVAQLLNSSDKPVKTTSTTNGVIEFYYVTPGTYYLRMFVDRNGNGLWDTGDYAANQQPEDVYYYPKEIECKEKWDLTLSWNIQQLNAAEQKPSNIVQQKADKQKSIKRRNFDRAKKLGLEWIQGQTY